MAFRDYEEFIAALNAHKVRYLIVGAHAVALHARPRATKDLDIWLDNTPANARKALEALRKFFSGAELGYTIADLVDSESVIQLGVAPVRIDLLSRVSGADFRLAWKNRVTARLGAASAYYIGLDDLIRAKEAAARPQDLADIDVLRRVKNRQSTGSRHRR